MYAKKKNLLFTLTQFPSSEATTYTNFSCEMRRVWSRAVQSNNTHGLGAQSGPDAAADARELSHWETVPWINGDRHRTDHFHSMLTLIFLSIQRMHLRSLPTGTYLDICLSPTGTCSLTYLRCNHHSPPRKSLPLVIWIREWHPIYLGAQARKLSHSTIYQASTMSKGLC